MLARLNAIYEGRRVSLVVVYRLSFTYVRNIDRAVRNIVSLSVDLVEVKHEVLFVAVELTRHRDVCSLERTQIELLRVGRVDMIGLRPQTRITRRRDAVRLEGTCRLFYEVHKGQVRNVGIIPFVVDFVRAQFGFGSVPNIHLAGFANTDTVTDYKRTCMLGDKARKVFVFVKEVVQPNRVIRVAVRSVGLRLGSPHKPVARRLRTRNVDCIKVLAFAIFRRVVARRFSVGRKHFVYVLSTYCIISPVRQ